MIQHWMTGLGVCSLRAWDLSNSSVSDYPPDVLPIGHTIVATHPCMAHHRACSLQHQHKGSSPKARDQWVVLWHTFMMSWKNESNIYALTMQADFCLSSIKANGVLFLPPILHALCTKWLGSKHLYKHLQVFMLLHSMKNFWCLYKQYGKGEFYPMWLLPIIFMAEGADFPPRDEEPV